MQKELKDAKVAIVTDGGLVPKGNPDSMPAVNSKTFKEYELKGEERLDNVDYEVSHQGYNNVFVNEDPNRLVPYDALKESVKEGKIAEVLPTYFTTVGVRTSLENAKKFGQGIAEQLINQGVDAVLLTST
ncbi:MAG: glycine/betaine/sarcosine/D-proline family reductase selenoprotein B [Clostridia bacterium]|nr:glycine/betaine/sarcosine/D-proline family reductase selenoprotein B [Clostridia bacterium]